MVLSSHWRVAAITSIFVLAACNDEPVEFQEDNLCARYPEIACHLLWAEDIAKNVRPENNEYGSDPAYVHWAGVDGETIYENRSKCAPFITHVLKQAYRAQSFNDAHFNTWFGTRSPYSRDYFDAITNGTGFTPIKKADDILPGDIIAIKYLPEDLTTEEDPTGHTAIARSKASPRHPTRPFERNTDQYEIDIIDSTTHRHGPTDSRYDSKDDSFDKGVGTATMRLYTNLEGEIHGYTWSTGAGSDFHDATTRPIVVGRLR